MFRKVGSYAMKTVETIATHAMPLAVAIASLAAAPLTSAAERTPTTQPISVAIYDDGGGSKIGPENVEKCLNVTKDSFKYKRVTAEDIRSGALKDVQVLVQPGGSGHKQAEALTQQGRDIIKEFVKNGGGYVGICAGSYLASSEYTWSLHIMNSKVVDREHWARGTGVIKLKLTDEGKKVLDIKDDFVDCIYNQGPLLGPANKDEPAPYEPLAFFETEVHDKGAPEGVMKGTTAIAKGKFGNGNVICISPHPERSPGLDGLIRCAVTWCAKGNESTTSVAK